MDSVYVTNMVDLADLIKYVQMVFYALCIVIVLQILKGV